MAEKPANTTLKTPQELAEELGQQIAQPPREPATVDEAIEQEIKREIEFGDRAGEAALTGAISGATLGLSDQLLIDSGAYTAEELQQIRERSPVAGTVGEVAGTVGSMFVPGAPLAQVSRLGAKGAQQLGRQALKTAGQAGIKNKFAKKAAKEITELGVLGAAEGAAVGVGEEISEAALQNKELTAEEIIASAGIGGLTGGLFGGTLGLGGTVLPTVKKGVGAIGKKVSGRARSLLDPEDALKGISGLTPRQIAQIEQRDANFFSKLRNYFVEDIKPTAFTSREELAAANTNALDKIGAQIGKLTKQLDEDAARLGVMPARQDFYERIARQADELAADPAEVLGEAAEGVVGPLKKLADRWRSLATKNEPLRLNEVNKLKKELQNFVYRNRNVPGFGAPELIDRIRFTVKQEISDVADRVAQQGEAAVANAAEELRALNEKFYVGKKVEDSLAVRAERVGGPSFRDLAEVGIAGTFAGPAGIALAGVRALASSDAARRLIAFRQVTKQREAVNSKIKDTVKFLTGAKKSAKQTGTAARRASTVILTKSALAANENGRKPENRQQAYTNIKNNIETLQNNPELLQERLVKARGGVGLLSPEIAALSAATSVRALQYLDGTMPRPPGGTGSILFPRPYQPSEMQLAKFERVLQVAEAPMTVLDDLERGDLTRDQVRALQAIYPNLYDKIRTELVQQVQGQGDKLSYQEKVQLGVLFDLPTDSALEPKTLLELQNNFATAQQQEAADESLSAVNTTVGGLGNVEFAGRKASGTQNVLQRVQQGD